MEWRMGKIGILIFGIAAGIFLLSGCSSDRLSSEEDELTVTESTTTVVNQTNKEAAVDTDTPPEVSEQNKTEEEKTVPYGFMIVGASEKFPLADENTNGEAVVLNGICTLEGTHRIMVQMKNGPIAYVPAADEEQENSFRQGDKVIVTAGKIAPEAKGTAEEGGIGNYMITGIAESDLPLYDQSVNGEAYTIATVCADAINGEEIHGILTQIPNGPVGFLQTRDVAEELSYKPGQPVQVKDGSLNRN